MQEPFERCGDAGWKGALECCEPAWWEILFRAARTNLVTDIHWKDQVQEVSLGNGTTLATDSRPCNALVGILFWVEGLGGQAAHSWERILWTHECEAERWTEISENWRNQQCDTFEENQQEWENSPQIETVNYNQQQCHRDGVSQALGVHISPIFSQCWTWNYRMECWPFWVSSLLWCCSYLF